MEKRKVRIYCLDGDTIEMVSRYDEVSGFWIEEYVDFECTPRYTPSGRPWKSVTTTDCPYSDPNFKDCGTCQWLIKEAEADLIGVCHHPRMRKDA